MREGMSGLRLMTIGLLAAVALGVMSLHNLQATLQASANRFDSEGHGRRGR